MTEVVSTKQLKKKDSEETCITFVNKVAGYTDAKAQNPRQAPMEKQDRVA